MKTYGKQRQRRAAAYIRMSTDKQVDSPERQRQIIEKLAERESCKVVEWFQDHGMTGTESSRREGFQELLAGAGMKRFDAVLLTEQSRFSREDVLDVMGHIRSLKAAGVDLITEQRGTINLDDFGSLLGLIVDAHAAHDESLKISSRSVLDRNVCNRSDSLPVGKPGSPARVTEAHCHLQRGQRINC